MLRNRIFEIGPCEFRLKCENFSDPFGEVYGSQIGIDLLNKFNREILVVDVIRQEFIKNKGDVIGLLRENRIHAVYAEDVLRLVDQIGEAHLIETLSWLGGKSSMIAYIGFIRKFENSDADIAYYAGRCLKLLRLWSKRKKVLLIGLKAVVGVSLKGFHPIQGSNLMVAGSKQYHLRLK
jgi:hypothetical protein